MAALLSVLSMLSGVPRAASSSASSSSRSSPSYSSDSSSSSLSMSSSSWSSSSSASCPHSTCSFSLFNWPELYATKLGLTTSQFLQPRSAPIRLATACSGAGTPSYCLDRIVGDQNYVEVVSSDSNKSVRAFLMKNTRPEHLHHDIAGGDCDVCGGPCRASPEREEDLYVCSAPCTPYSLLSGKRLNCRLCGVLKSDSGANAFLN